MYHKTLAIRHLDISTLMQCPVDKLLAVTFYPLKRRMLLAKFQARNQALLRPVSSLTPCLRGPYPATKTVIIYPFRKFAFSSGPFRDQKT